MTKMFSQLENFKAILTASPVPLGSACTTYFTFWLTAFFMSSYSEGTTTIYSPSITERTLDKTKFNISFPHIF